MGVLEFLVISFKKVSVDVPVDIVILLFTIAASALFSGFSLAFFVGSDVLFILVLVSVSLGELQKVGILLFQVGLGFAVSFRGHSSILGLYFTWSLFIFNRGFFIGCLWNFSAFFNGPIGVDERGHRSFVLIGFLCHVVLDDTLLVRLLV